MTDPLRPLDGKIVLIAGASSGMGRATAVSAARAGAHVILGSRNVDGLHEVHAAIATEHGMSTIEPVDLTDWTATREWVNRVHQQVGRIDAVVDSVGTNIKARTLGELTTDTWSGMIATNLTSAFNITQAIVPIFRAQRGGLIIYISSSAAKKADASGVAYQATKAGLVGLANGTMEEERAHGIRTTVVFPGFTDTPMVLKRPTPTPPDILARALQPKDVAAACLFVLSLPARAHVPELVLYPSQN